MSFRHLGSSGRGASAGGPPRLSSAEADGRDLQPLRPRRTGCPAPPPFLLRMMPSGMCPMRPYPRDMAKKPKTHKLHLSGEIVPSGRLVAEKHPGGDPGRVTSTRVGDSEVPYASGSDVEDDGVITIKLE